jgi:hypothetical protein
VLLFWALIEYWWVLLIAAIVPLVVTIVFLACSASETKRLETDVVEAKVISEEPIVERVAEKTGYSIGYGRYLSSRDYFRYKNVITGYKVKFAVQFKDGKHKLIECNKDSKEYSVLIFKVK